MSIDHSLHSIFGASKVAADVLVQEYGRYFGLRTACFRGGTLTGPNHSAAELHGFLAYVMRCVMTGTPYTVFGYKGKQVRDAIHSRDLIRAFDEFFRAPRVAEVYNIGGGRFSNASVHRGDRARRRRSRARSSSGSTRTRTGSATTSGGSATTAASSHTIRTGSSSTTFGASSRRSATRTASAGVGGHSEPARGQPSRAARRPRTSLRDENRRTPERALPREKASSPRTPFRSRRAPARPRVALQREDRVPERGGLAPGARRARPPPPRSRRPSRSSADAAATTGRPAAKYDVSFEGSDMSVTEARWFTSSTSAACMAASHLPGPCSPTKSTFASPASRSLALEPRPIVPVADERDPYAGSTKQSGRRREGCRVLAFVPCSRRGGRRTHRASSRSRRRVSSIVSSGSMRRVQFRSRSILLGRDAARFEVAPEVLSDDADGRCPSREPELDVTDDPGDACSARNAALLRGLAHQILEHEAVRHAIPCRRGRGDDAPGKARGTFPTTTFGRQRTGSAVSPRASSESSYAARCAADCVRGT